MGIEHWKRKKWGLLRSEYLPRIPQVVLYRLVTVCFLRSGTNKTGIFWAPLEICGTGDTCQIFGNFWAFSGQSLNPITVSTDIFYLHHKNLGCIFLKLCILYKARSFLVTETPKISQYLKKPLPKKNRVNPSPKPWHGMQIWCWVEVLLFELFSLNAIKKYEKPDKDNMY